MADLKSTFLGIESPNPFWLASAPPTDKAYNVNRAFEAGWGGVVWKTLGEDGPPIVNVSGPRYSALHSNDRRVIGRVDYRPAAANQSRRDSAGQEGLAGSRCRRIGHVADE
jgi:dihydroorotate dehydrogenase